MNFEINSWFYVFLGYFIADLINRIIDKIQISNKEKDNNIESLQEALKVWITLANEIRPDLEINKNIELQKYFKENK
jgi:hypothetical protein